jgi:hypothetical protein
MGLLYREDPVKKPGTINDGKDTEVAMRYIKANPEEARIARIEADKAADDAFNFWADDIERKLGGDYKMNRKIVRDRFYIDPKTRKPYSVESGYNTANRMRAKDNYYNAFKQFHTENNLPVNGGLRKEAERAFYKDYPQSNNEKYDSYSQLDPAKVAMYKDPSIFQKQQNAWKIQNANRARNAQFKKGGILYRK